MYIYMQISATCICLKMAQTCEHMQVRASCTSMIVRSRASRPACENLEFSLLMGSLASQSSHQTTVATQVVLKIQVLSAGSSPRLPTATPQNSFDMSLEMDWRVPTVVTVIPLVFGHARFHHWTLAHSRIIPTKQGCWIHHETPETWSQCPSSNVAFVVIWKSDV